MEFLTPQLLEEDDLATLPSSSLKSLDFYVVMAADNWLDTSYQLLTQEFSADLLDPHERYVNWLDLNRQGKHKFPFLLIAAFIRHNEKALVVGVLEGNIMPIADYLQHATPHYPVPFLQDGSYVFAVGHQVTSALLRSNNIKGVGTRLWNQGILSAKMWVQERGGVLRYAVLESVDASIGFWNRVGFRWPKGAPYCQPPLEFDDDGRPLYDSVEELLMFNPVEPTSSTVSRDLVLNVVATLYLNWSLDAYRDTLEPAAMKRAEDFVMGELFSRIVDTTPMQNEFDLVRVDSKPQFP